MKKFELFMTKHHPKVFLILLLTIQLNTCGNPTKPLSKKIDVLSQKIDSLERIIVTKRDLKVEGLRAEKRMIQSTDRKILDVNRQAEIDKEISSLEK